MSEFMTLCCKQVNYEKSNQYPSYMEKKMNMENINPTFRIWTPMCKTTIYIILENIKSLPWSNIPMPLFLNFSKYPRLCNKKCNVRIWALNKHARYLSEIPSLKKSYRRKYRQTLIRAPRAIIKVESSGHSELCLFQSVYEKISPFPRTCNMSGAFLAHWYI